MARQVALGWLDPHIVGHYQLEIANDIFNGMGHALSCSPLTPHMVTSVMPCCLIVLHCDSRMYYQMPNSSKNKHGINVGI
jgi:hypothetical protein